MNLIWKEFNVDLMTIQSAIKAIAPGCCGLTAHRDGLVVEGQLSAEQREDIGSYWDSLTVESPEALNYHSQSSIKTKESELKLDAATKTWDQLSAVQKKLILGLSVSPSELFA